MNMYMTVNPKSGQPQIKKDIKKNLKDFMKEVFFLELDLVIL